MRGWRIAIAVLALVAVAIAAVALLTVRVAASAPTSHYVQTGTPLTWAAAADSAP